MKYTFIILFTILSVPAFSQQPIPGLKSFQFQANGIILTHKNNQPDDTASFSWSIPAVSGTPDTSGITHFYFESNSTGKRTLSLSIDPQQQLITSFIYTYHRVDYVPQQTSQYTIDSSFVLKNIPCTLQGDTVSIELDSEELVHCIVSANSSVDWTYLRNNHTERVDQSSYAGVAPGGYFQYYVVGMHTESSSLIPQYYVLPLHTDTTGQKYGPDSVSINYFNNFADTVLIRKIEFTDPFASVMNITYDDGSSLLSPKIILPNEKHQKFPLRITSKEGPHEQSRTIPFTLTKKIGDSLYTENFSIKISTKTIDYEPGITVGPDYVYFRCNVGDTVLGTAEVTFSDDIKQLNFPPIDTTKGYTLTNVKIINIDHLPNKKIIHFMYTPKEAGSFGMLYGFKYSIVNFNGKQQEYDCSKTIDLISDVFPTNGVIEDQKSTALHIFPNPTSGDVSILLTDATNDPLGISICDLLGNILQKEQITAKNNTLSFHIRENIPDGTYLAMITGSNIFVREKVVVMRH